MLSYYLEITTSMDDNSYTARIIIEDALLLGFNNFTLVQRPDIEAIGWLIIDGSLVTGPPDFYQFQVHRFSRFAFMDPLLPPNHLYICTDVFQPATSGEVYQNDDGGLYFPGDWGYTPDEQQFSIYIKPEDGSAFYGCNVQLKWDDEILEYQSITSGNLWSLTGYNFFTSPESPRDHIIIQAAAQNVPPHNLTVGSGEYIAKLTFKMIRPGFTPIEFLKTDFRDATVNPVYFVSHYLKVKYFLADFRSSSSEFTGDGNVDFSDLSSFSLVYNATTTGWSGTEWLPSGTLYRRKYDIGPTDGSHYIFDHPQPDNKIDFEDLILFSFSYGFSNEFIYPEDLPTQPGETVTLSATPPLKRMGDEESNDGLTEIPIHISRIPDLKGFQVKVKFLNDHLIFEDLKATSFPLRNDEFCLIFKTFEKQTLTVDCAFFTSRQRALSYQGTLFTILCRTPEGQTPRIQIDTAIVRDSFNRNYSLNFSNPQVNRPERFEISRAYPNPFNASTRFTVSLPTATEIRVDIYNCLGQQIKSLYRGVLNAGMWSFAWDGKNALNSEVPSGMYYFVTKAKQTCRVQKILLLK
ncbi:MAG: hypothetical protein Kow0042_13990 [Calditrichia bacterium]